MKIRYELKGCKLVNAETDAELLTFDARAVQEYQVKGGFAGSGIASGGHAYSVATAAEYNFTPFNHVVIIGGVRFIITARRFITHKPLGKRFAKGVKREMVLDLE